MTLAHTTLTAHLDINEDVCVDCEESQAEGYSGCGECTAPDEQWEYTTPTEVWEV